MSQPAPSDNIVHIRERMTRIEQKQEFDRMWAARELDTTKATLEREIELLRLDVQDLRQSIRELSGVLREQLTQANSSNRFADLTKLALAVAIPIVVLLITGDPKLAASTGKAAFGAP